MKIRGKVLPLVEMVLAGKTLQTSALDISGEGSISLSSSGSKAIARTRRDAVCLLF